MIKRHHLCCNNNKKAGVPTRLPGQTFAGQTFPPDFDSDSDNPLSPVATCRPCPWEVDDAFNRLLTTPGLRYQRRESDRYKLSCNNFKIDDDECWPPKGIGPSFSNFDICSVTITEQKCSFCKKLFIVDMRENC
ncbi:hypothetical protein MHBO_002256 [Bonamia ostreae]|uniref:Uncharacterized protein n=1 Tax=Bonamia ostreae TaxID=126728 RepID=A0ABV2AM72_9EUKA